MKKLSILILLLFIIISCSSKKMSSDNTNQTVDSEAFVLKEISTDKTYGLSPANPIEVGGVKDSQGPKNERRYLDALSGPKGEKVSYFRAGSCCPVKSKNGFMGFAMLDNYRVTWQNSKDTVSIYLNMYDSGKLKAPVGFQIKN